MTVHRHPNMLSAQQPAPAHPHRHPTHFPGDFGGTGMYCLSVTPQPTSTTAPRSINAHTPPAISNRHLVQLKFTATHAQSTRSLFLIVPKRTYYSQTRLSSPEVRWHRHVLPVSGFLSKSEHLTTISNRHLVQLEFVASRPESTTSLFLIDPKHTHFRTVPEAQ
jgi:hypothetical protein